jgi:hypothetical protein
MHIIYPLLFFNIDYIVFISETYYFLPFRMKSQEVFGVRVYCIRPGDRGKGVCNTPLLKKIFGGGSIFPSPCPSLREGRTWDS